jgi:uncharacterized protein YecA (UPF0149 family)
MNIPSNFDMNKILPILKSFGVNPEKLGPDKLERLQNIAGTISDPSQITPELSRQVLDILGINIRAKESPNIRIGKRIGRNDPCTCGSGIKYKKCGLLQKC